MLKVLLVEDNADDAELLERHMQRERMGVQIKTVESRRAFTTALNGTPWDIVLVDFSLPQFSAMEVLEILARQKLDIPVILVTGTLSEEHAVKFIKQGGDDFILKSSLRRLGSAITKAIEKKSLEREKRRAQAAARESDERLRLVIDGVKDYAICMLDPAQNEFLGVPRRKSSVIISRPFTNLV